MAYDDVPRQQMLTDVLEFLGLALSDTNREQLAVMLEALELFDERNVKYGDLWQEGGWQDSAAHLRSKAARVHSATKGTLLQPYNFIDDALDAMNYAAFYVRNVRADR